MLWIFVILISLVSVVIQKFDRISGFISFLGIGYLVGTPNYQFNRDAVVYANAYSFRTDVFERGYNLLTDSMWNHFDYQTFRLLSSMAVYMLLFFILILFTKKVSLISLVYAFSMYPFDSEQVRNVMAGLFILLGAYLLNKFKNKGIIPAMGLIFLGSLFHSLALLFLVLPIMWFARNNIEKHFKVYFTIGSVFALAFEVLGTTRIVPVLASIIDRISSRENISNNVLTVYNVGATHFKMWLVFYILTIIIVVTGYRFYRKSQSIHEYYQLYVCTIILWTFSLGLFAISVDYVRTLRLVSYFFFILIASLVQNSAYYVDKIKMISMSLVISLLLMFSQYWIYGMNFEQFKGIIGL